MWILLSNQTGRSMRWRLVFTSQRHVRDKKAKGQESMKLIWVLLSPQESKRELCFYIIRLLRSLLSHFVLSNMFPYHSHAPLTVTGLGHWRYKNITGTSRWNQFPLLGFLVTRVRSSPMQKVWWKEPAEITWEDISVGSSSGRPRACWKDDTKYLTRPGIIPGFPRRKWRTWLGRKTTPLFFCLHW